jgi:hypothetical protein
MAIWKLFFPFGGSSPGVGPHQQPLGATRLNFPRVFPGDKKFQVAISGKQMKKCKKGPRDNQRQHRNFPQRTRTILFAFCRKKDMIPFMTAPKEHRCQFSIKLPSQCRRKRHSTNVVRLKLFDPCSCQKRAIKYFVFTHRRAQHDFAGNLGAILSL